MLRAIIKNWLGKERIVPLQEALNPTPLSMGGGVAESAREVADASANAAAGLAALLVRRGIITVDEAACAMGVDKIVLAVETEQ